MNQVLLFTGGLLSLLLTAFKIAMPYLFHWQAAMNNAGTEMWPILYAENLGISLLLLSFAYMSIFQWRELISTRLGKTVLLSIAGLWIFRAAAEIILFGIGVAGEWWRFFLFLALALIYLAPVCLPIWVRKAAPNPSASHTSLDEILPVFEFSGTQSCRVRAAPDQIFAALRQVTPSDMPLAMFLIRLRYLPARWLGHKIENTPANQPILESVLHYYQVLAEQPDRELIIGQVGRLDKVVQEGVTISNREEFTNFKHPDYQKYVLGIRTEGNEVSEGVKLIIEHRVHAPGKAARRGFARYWIVIQPASALMLRMLLGAIRRRAGRGAKLSHLQQSTGKEVPG